MIKMRSCVVPGCYNKTGRFQKSRAQLEKERIVKITYHRLPINPNKRKLWLDSLEIPDPGLNKQTVLCLLHFSNALFDKTSMSRVRLRTMLFHMYVSVESIEKVTLPLIFNNEGTMVGEVKHKDEGSNIVALTISEPLDNSSMNGITMETYCLDSSSIEDKETFEELCVSEGSYSSMHHNQTTRSTSISPERSISLMQSYSREVKDNESGSTSVSLEQSLSSSQDDSHSNMSSSVLIVQTEIPEEIHLRRALANTKNLYRRKIRMLQQKHRRYEKRIAALRDIINVSMTKDLPADGELEILHDIDLVATLDHQYCLPPTLR